MWCSTLAAIVFLRLLGTPAPPSYPLTETLLVDDVNNEFGVANNPLRIDPTGTTTQPISGTVTANIGTSGSLALDASVLSTALSQGSTTSGQKGHLTLGAVTLAAPSYTTGQTSPLSLTLGGALRIDGSAVTQPISGTVTVNAGTGTFAVSGTVTANIGTTNGLALDASVTGLQVSQGSTTSGQKGGLALGAVTTGAPSYTTAQTSPLSLTTSGLLRVDGSSVTQPVSAVSLPLPTGAATSAKQPALGTAGAASADVISVQGVAGGVAQPVSGTVTANAGTGTFAVSAASLPLPTGASTSANQTTLGNQTTKVNDGTNTMAVKAASTAAAAADPAAVVALSPNSATPMQADRSGSGTITALNGAVAANTQGAASISIQLTGTWAATLGVEGTTNGGTTWNPISAVVVGTENEFLASFTTANILWQVPCGGYQQVRVRAVLFTSGTATVAWNASAAPNAVQVHNYSAAGFQSQVQGPGASGAVVSGNPVRVAGSDGTNTRDVLTDSTGRLIVSQVDGPRATYSACTTALATAATATDIFTVTGSGTTTVRVTRVEISATQTTSGVVNFLLVKRSTANTAGTSTTLTSVPLDSNSAAATATARSYTANPTLGTTVGTLRAGKSFVSATLATPTDIVWDFGVRPGTQESVLRGTTQVLAVNLNATTVAGSSFDICAEWTEE